MSVSYMCAGSDLARVIGNALLFAENKSRYVPGVVLVDLSDVGLAVAGFNDYVVGRDLLGRDEWQHRFTVTADDAEIVEKAARSARRGAVTMSHDSGEMRLSDGETELATVPTSAPSDVWERALEMLEPTGEPGEMPQTFALGLGWMWTLGRVKPVHKSAPADIRIEPGARAPVALVRIGPTFRAALAAIDREQAERNMGDGAAGAFWLPRERPTCSR